jgi:hypothetical protein
MLTWIIATLSVGAAICGIYSARLWYRSSQVPARPLWTIHGWIEPVDQNDRNNQLIAGLLVAAQDSAAINQKAARWAARASALGGATAMMSAIAVWLSN